MYDLIVAGSGFAGSVVAREFAEKGKIVLVVEKRNHIGGNMYDKMDENGIPVHIYGPHIFHTNSKNVVDYITRFGEFKNYEHTVLGYIDDKYVPIPFNFKSLEELLPDKADELKVILTQKYEGKISVSVYELIQSDNEIIKELGNFIFNKVFLNYTAKQWGIPAADVDISVLNRVPVVLGYDNRYFRDTYQLMPKISYTHVFNKLLEHKNIEIKLNTDALSLLKINEDKIFYEGKVFNGQVYYTGAIDELFGYCYGQLPYRSVHMQFETLNQNLFQKASVINYPNDYDFTRITEFKHFYQPTGNTTTILKEFPLPYDKDATKGNIPYYVIPGEENVKKYQKYKDLASDIKNLKLIGRLAEYKYYNMDTVIEKALELTKNI